MGLCCLPVIYLGPNYGGDNEDNGDLFQKIPCIYYYTQCSRPCSRPPLTYASIGDSWTLMGKSGSVSCGSLLLSPGSWCARGWFEPSEHLWQERGLILNANSPLLLSCWGFSFALGRGVSPHSHSSAYRLTGVFLTLDVGYLHMAGPVKRRHCS